MAGTFHAPASSQHHLLIEQDALSIRPSIAKILAIRAVLMTMGAAAVYGAGKQLAVIDPGWGAVPLAFAALFGLVVVLGAVAPWKTLHAHIDARGIHLRGRGLAQSGALPWSSVQAVVVERPLSGGPARRGTWKVGLVLVDGATVGLLGTQSALKASALSDALVEIGRKGGRAELAIVAPLPPDGDAPPWPPEAPAGFPLHPRVRVEETPEGCSIGPVQGAEATAKRYFGLGVAGVTAAFAGMGWVIAHYGWGFAWNLGAGLAMLAGGLVLEASRRLIGAGLHLRKGPHRHVVTHDAILVVSRDLDILARFPIAEVRAVGAGGNTLVLDLGEDENGKLHFEGVGALDDLYWSMRALEYVLHGRGWSPRGGRMSRRDFDKASGWRPRVSVHVSSGGTEGFVSP